MPTYHYLDLNMNDEEATPGYGPIPAEYAFVGIAPTMTRTKADLNMPFGPSSMKVINAAKAAAGDPDIYLTNLVKHPLPATELPKIKVVRRFVPSLMAELTMVQPKRILAMGAPVAKVLCGSHFKSLKEDHGAFFWNEELNAFIIPTYPFSAGARNYDIKQIIGRDLERFFNLPDPEYPKYQLVQWGIAAAQESAGIVLFSELARYIHEGDKVFLDIETTGLDARVDEILSIGFKTPEMEDMFIVPHPSLADLNYLREFFTAQRCVLIGHNFQFDLYFLCVKSENFWNIPVEDTMLMAYVHGEMTLSLKHLTVMYTDRPGSHSFGGPEDHAYLAEDVYSTSELYSKFLPMTKDSFARELLNDLVPTTVGMRIRGVHIDHSKLTDLSLYYLSQSTERRKILDDLNDGIEINWNSSQQIVSFLLNQGVKLKDKTATGNFAVSEMVLLSHAEKYPVVKQILDLRESEKMLQFIKSYDEMTKPDHPYLHPRLLLHGTRTGRLSCVDPNLQQVPRVGPIKTLFVPRWEGGKIGLIDLSQAELRVAALLSNDEEFAALLLAGDAHRANAAAIYGKPEDEVSSAERKKIKGITFGLLYGGSPGGLAFRVGVPKTEVEQILRKFFLRYPKLTKWLEKTKKEGIASGEVFTPLGRRRDLLSLIAMESISSAERKAVNTPVQSTASDIALCILRPVANGVRQQKLISRPMIGVHDSVLIEIYPTEVNQVGQLVQEGFAALGQTPLGQLPLFGTLPLVGELIVGDSWAQIESTNENYNPDNLIVFPCSSSGVPQVIHPDQDSDDEEQEELDTYVDDVIHE